MLRKQTVWLLTLLSLMIVLSVFYMRSPDQDDLSFIFKENKDGETQLTSNDLTGINDDILANLGIGNQAEENDFSSVQAKEELFTFFRMQMAELRSAQIEQLESVVASGATSAMEKNNAIETMQQISELATREQFIEETLKDEYGYPDVLVRTVDESVIVTIKTDELSETEANQIMRTVYDEFGSMRVQVKFQQTS